MAPAREQTTHPGGQHPDLPAEQAYIERAYQRLDEMRGEARARAAALYDQRSGTPQHLYERDVAVGVALARAEDLDIGDLSLLFGRIDREDGERYYIGRRGVFDEQRHPLVVDWRVPAAEPFYRATGRHPMGLELRRHLMCEGPTLLGIEDERFTDGELGLAGTGALVAALERARTGRMRDIVSTVQAEQDKIIRADLDGVLAVQGGPGTGKTAVALHRAAYLMFTHRRKLGGQGILIVGPNRLFLRYIEQVLPALGESGATMVTLADLVDEPITGADPPEIARVKGKPTMGKVVARAITDRQRALRADVVIAIDQHEVPLRARETARLVAKAKRNRRPHNLRRAMLRNILVVRLTQRYYQVVERSNDPMPLTRAEVRKVLRSHPGLRKALDAMWPELTPGKLLRDLYASPRALASAARGVLRAAERDRLRRGKGASFTMADVPLLDEARWRLGVTRASAKVREGDDEDEVPTFGHVIVDEVQDLSPMALRMLGRRSRTGSMTVVGDLAQAVGARPPQEWRDILRHLPNTMGQAVTELSINYRTPSEIMDVAERVLAAVAPHLRAPDSVRSTGEHPSFVRTTNVVEAAAARAREVVGEVSPGTVAVIVPVGVLERMSVALPEAEAGGLDAAIALLTVEEAKGLEFDGVVLVEPAQVEREHDQGLHALYVALTRATTHLSVVHSEALPVAMRARDAALRDADLRDAALRDADLRDAAAGASAAPADLTGRR